MGLWQRYWDFNLKAVMIMMVVFFIVFPIYSLLLHFEFDDWKYVYVLNENNIAYPAIAIKQKEDGDKLVSYYIDLRPKDVPKQFLADPKSFEFIHWDEPIKIISYTEDSLLVEIEARFLFDDLFPSFKGYIKPDIIKEKPPYQE